MSDILTPLSDCPVSLASCCPAGTDAYSIYQAQKSLCLTVEYLLGTVNALKDTIPDQDRISGLQRRITSLTREVERLKKSAIVCISRNEDTCEIQGAVLDGPIKVFPKDPCSADLVARVSALENDLLVSGSITTISNEVIALSSSLNSAVKLLSVDGADLRIETVGGAVSAVDVKAFGSSVITQEVLTTSVADPNYIIPFTVGTDSVVEIDLGFINPVGGLIYNLAVRTAAEVVINSYTGLGVGTTTDTDTDGVTIFHKTRKALINLAAGSYQLYITEDTAANLVSLQISTQIKSLP